MFEWQLADKKICAFFIAMDFAERNSAEVITVWLLYPFHMTDYFGGCLGGRQLFDHLKLVLYDATEQLDKAEKKIEMMKSK